MTFYHNIDNSLLMYQQFFTLLNLNYQKNDNIFIFLYDSYLAYKEVIS